MSSTTWIYVAFLGFFMLHMSSAQSCEERLQAVIPIVSTIDLPISVLGQLADPEMNFYRQNLRFTDEEIQQEMQNAMNHYSTRFGLNFSSVQPNDRGQRIIGNATFYFLSFPFNVTAPYNRWMVNGRTTTRCFPVGIGGFQVDFTGDMMIHGTYGGEDGILVVLRDSFFYGYDVIYDACAQQPISILAYTDFPIRTVPNEGWMATDFVLSHRQLGRGVARGVTRFFFPPDRPDRVISETHEVYSFN